jgi:4-diphosphocytidyl-2-C-methyl-D-erythritol kinase
MLDLLCVPAYAKVNLSLKILPKRNDGYHNLESLFQLINIYDELQIKKTDIQSCCKVTCPGFNIPENNTITSIYEEFSKVTGITQGLEVNLIKRIPSGAGLGGGSSDGASFLRALNSMFNTNLSYDICAKIALKTGSDVPFFLAGGTTIYGYDNNTCCVVSGRGELIQKIDSRKDLIFIIICPDVHSSTKDAYSLIDEYPDCKKDSECPALEDLEAEYRKNPQQWKFCNSFTYLLSRKYPKINQALIDLKKSGADYYQMSGSGSTVFGVFLSREKAELAKKQLDCKWKRCFILPSS